MTKALNHKEAKEYIIKYMMAGLEAQLDVLNDEELVHLFKQTTGQELILPAVKQEIVSAGGGKIEIPRNEGDSQEESETVDE